MIKPLDEPSQHSRLKDVAHDGVHPQRSTPRTRQVRRRKRSKEIKRKSTWYYLPNDDDAGEEDAGRQPLQHGVRDRLDHRVGDEEDGQRVVVVVPMHPKVILHAGEPRVADVGPVQEREQVSIGHGFLRSTNQLSPRVCAYARNTTNRTQPESLHTAETAMAQSRGPPSTSIFCPADAVSHNAGEDCTPKKKAT